MFFLFGRIHCSPTHWYEVTEISNGSGTDFLPKKLIVMVSGFKLFGALTGIFNR